MVGRTLITPDTVVLVSGGARGITAQCVIKLANSIPCKFILLGRTPVNEALPKWALECPDDAELKRRTMNQLTSEGKKATPQVVEKYFAKFALGRMSKKHSRRCDRLARPQNI